MRAPSLLYFISRVLCSPMEVLFALLIFILSNNLQATVFQITLIACLKPITSLLAFYAGSTLHGKKHRIRSYLIINSLVGSIPCLFFPFIDNVWFYIASYGIFMITMRAQEPAWIEILNGQLDFKSMSKTVSIGSSIHYFVIMVLPPILAIWLDRDVAIWRILFVMAALFQLLNLFALIFIPSGSSEEKVSRSFQVIDPLKRGWELLRNNPSFTHYLILFFLGGAGLIAIQPILPKYFHEELSLSYTELTLAFSLCKGISFLLSSPIWVKYVARHSLYQVNVLMNIFSCLFIAGILAAQGGMVWLYIAYLFYGTMQGGCAISWNLSGPIFSKQGDSTFFSSLNLLLVGIRGCICPILGFLLFTYTSALPVLLTAFSLCFIGIFYGRWLNNAFKVDTI